jgi:crooked neck
MFAKFELRRLELVSARKILGTAIGMCPKEVLFKGYIDLEVEVSVQVYIFIVVLKFYLAS